MKKIVFIVLIFVFTLSLISCENGYKEEEQTENVYFSGVIIEMNEHNAIVEPFSGKEILNSADKISVYLGNEYEDYEVGDRIKVEYTGEVMESYPAQIDVISIEKID